MRTIAHSSSPEAGRRDFQRLFGALISSDFYADFLPRKARAATQSLPDSDTAGRKIHQKDDGRETLRRLLSGV